MAAWFRRKGKIGEPRARGGLLLGNTMQMIKNPLGFVRSMYQSTGPVCRFRFMTKSALLLAGPKAKKLMTTAGDDCLDREFFYGQFAEQMGAENLIFTATGEAHAQLRKATSLAFSRRVAAQHIPSPVSAMVKRLDHWKPGEKKDALDVAAELVYASLGPLMTPDKGDDALYPDVQTPSDGLI